MPIPFYALGRHNHEAAVAYLRFVARPSDGSIQGALFVISSRGDPLEFCFTQVGLPVGPFWRPEQAYRQVVAALSRALFDAVGHLPALVLVLAEETPTEVFAEEMEVQVPVCVVDNHTQTGAEVQDVEASRDDSVSLRWGTEKPSDDSEIIQLVEYLRSRRLLLEPFERAAQGLEEAFLNP